MRIILAALAGLALALLPPGGARAQQEAFTLIERSGTFAVALDDIAADEALREFGRQLGFEVAWRAQGAAARLTGRREGAAAQIVAWILRGYDYAMVTSGRGIEQRPVRIVVFSERSAAAPAPLPAPPDDTGDGAALPDGLPPSPETAVPEAPDEVPPGAGPELEGYPDPSLAPYDPADFGDEPPA